MESLNYGKREGRWISMLSFFSILFKDSASGSAKKETFIIIRFKTAAALFVPRRIMRRDKKKSN